MTKNALLIEETKLFEICVMVMNDKYVEKITCCCEYVNI